ncbi:hypothetical protein [Flagellimonas iocasae]|uniref:Cytochrome C and Quinol oxidase polypeptide I n=1 Tax=Flagellimonas iocasae TaxID=2055905 RepID=A0ABW4XYJ3_9FLAO
MKYRVHQQHVKIAMVYFGIAALLGILLRSYAIFSFDFNYRHMVHAHSHIALLGWIYVALTTILHYCFVKRDTVDKKYSYIFWSTQATLIGMLFTFPFQGYALFSIIFSTLFLMVSYVYVYHFWKNIDPKYKHSKGLQCVKAALIYMIISSLGPWALGAIMNTLGPQSIWYRLAIYFYLHFQYNGWMILALVGLFLFALEQRGTIVPNKSFQRFFWMLNVGVVLTFFLSSLWIEPSALIYLLAGLGALIQLFAFLFFWEIIKNEIINLSLSILQNLFIKTVMLLVLIKIVLQLLTSLPYFARMATIYLEFTIGYLHMTFLGVISIGLFFLMDYFGLFRISKKLYRLYFLGFLITEILIFYKGFSAWQQWAVFDGYTEVLALTSLLIPISLVLLLVKNRS